MIKETPLQQGKNKYMYWLNKWGKLYLLHSKNISTIEKEKRNA